MMPIREQTNCQQKILPKILGGNVLQIGKKTQLEDLVPSFLMSLCYS